MINIEIGIVLVYQNIDKIDDIIDICWYWYYLSITVYNCRRLIYRYFIKQISFVDILITFQYTLTALVDNYPLKLLIAISGYKYLPITIVGGFIDKADIVSQYMETSITF